ncbi:MAG: TAXI family TRAP transporter solute-binding subunit [Pseudomonadota bacterium]
MKPFKDIAAFKAIAVSGAIAFAASMAVADDKADWPDSFSVGTASQGGTYFVYGAGWANMVSEALGLPGGTEVTGGPVQNAALVQAGELDMAMVTMGPAFDAINGESALAPGLKHDQIRAIFPMYKTGFHAVTLASSGITSFESIPDGSVVGVGPAGGTPGTYWPRILTGMGKDVEFRNGGASDLAGQLQDGLIDVMTWAGGLPYPAFSQLDAQTDVVYFGFTPQEQTAVIETQPVSTFEIPAGMYPSLNEDQLSVSMWNFAIGHADLPDSFVYEVVKTVMENNPGMMEVHKAAVETLPENFDKNTFIPWHPGAVKWFEENGFDIPDDLEG